MNRRELDKLSLLCKKEKIKFHTKKIAVGNYSVFITEERRTITHHFRAYPQAKEKVEEIIYLRTSELTWDEWYKGGRQKS